MKITLQLLSFLLTIHYMKGCQFHPAGEYLRFVRVPEDLPVGGLVLHVQVYPRKNLTIQPVDKADDVGYFEYRNVNKTTVGVYLAKSLDDLVDGENPQNVLKFRLTCDFIDGDDTVTSYLSVTVYVEDINDHSPVFVDAPYNVTVDELTPTGLAIFRGILAVDRDKPNTPNSDVQYSIVGGNERGRFSLENTHRPVLQLRKLLDYDSGDRLFLLTIAATDRGIPPKSSNTTVTVTVSDNDDLPPKFTRGVYRTKITEFYPIQGVKIHKELKFEPRIYAFDQDAAINAPIRYEILAGNERRLFALDSRNGSIFLQKEIDLDQERTLPGNTFVLQIQAAQLDNPLKTGVARIEIEIIDLNDNLPEFEVDFYNISIVENLPNGFSVLQVIATDADQGDNGEFTYVLEDKSGAFNLDSRTGWLTVRDQTVLDREKRSSIEMRVLAKEKAPSVVLNRHESSSVGIEVSLLDANDNNPSFTPSNLYEFTGSTEMRIGDLIGSVTAQDPDLGLNGMVLYDIQRNGNNQLVFVVDPRTGRILVNEAPLLEGRYVFFVEASDQPANPSERRYSLAVVTVDVSKLNNADELPEFIGAPYEFWVGANAGIGTSIGQIRITDAFDSNTLIYDLLHSYVEGVPFAVEERSGVITVVDELSKFDRALYDFEAVVTDSTQQTLVTNVTIHVVDPHDERRILMKGTNSTPIEFHVRENVPGAIIGQLFYNSSNDLRSLRFLIANQQEVAEDVGISADGTLYARRALDRERKSMYHLTIIAQFNRGVRIYQVIVHVEDENDNAPVFDHATYEGQIKENSPIETQVQLNFPIRATDLDFGTNALITFKLFGEGSELFEIKNGEIFYKSNLTLDREQKNKYQIKINATDTGGLNSEANLNLNILDENDNAPKFQQIKIINNQTLAANKTIDGPLFLLSEQIPIGTTVLQTIADDIDSKQNAIITYSLVSPKNQYFAVQSTGEIITMKLLQPETDFQLNISAGDPGGLSDYLSIHFHVFDENNHAPIFKKSFYNFNIQEGEYENLVLGKIEATDADFGKNANVSYSILSDKQVPFNISEFGGELIVDGAIDREFLSKYNFRLLAKDNPEIGEKLNSSVDVEVNILDLNDNAPEFYGFDEIISVLPPEAELITNHNFQSTKMLPVYYAAVAENSPIGTPITRVFANDSDFSGNGNGLILFNIPEKNVNVFAVDSKDGVVTIVGKLDYEMQQVHNVTVVASDLGSPSLSSTALIMVTVIDVPDYESEPSYADVPVFAHRYYEVEVEENCDVPVRLLALNVTEPYQSHRLRFSFVPSNDSDLARSFRVDNRNGSVFLIASPDREKRSRYQFKIRLDRVKQGRGIPVMVYPITSERLSGLAPNEVKVIVRVTDLNDNVPKFPTNGRPIVATVSTSVNYGENVVKLEAVDPDEDCNGAVRYQMLGRGAVAAAADDSVNRFAIDPMSGQVRSVGSFTHDAGRVFGFDVKATDREGADDGRSSIANVFVYVIDERKQLVMVMDSKPTQVEQNINQIMMVLFNTTGYDVRVRKLEPHFDRNYIDYSATDLYLYAVDPHLNVIIDMDHLQQVLTNKKSEIDKLLPEHRILEITNDISEHGLQTRSQRYLLSTLEVGVVVLGCVIFIGALATALCVLCIRKNRRSELGRKYAQSQAASYSLPTDHLKPPLFPTSYGVGVGDGIQYTEPTDSYLTVLRTSKRHNRTLSGRRHYQYQHDRNCVRFSARRQAREMRKMRGAPFEHSVTSLHSSGKDSGVVDVNGRCQCGGEHSTSTTHTSDNSSTSSYEDSLKSQHLEQHRRNRSFPEIHNNPPKIRRQSAALVRKSSGRTFFTCPGNVSVSA